MGGVWVGGGWGGWVGVGAEGGGWRGGIVTRHTPYIINTSLIVSLVSLLYY